MTGITNLVEWSGLRKSPLQSEVLEVFWEAVSMRAADKVVGSRQESVRIGRHLQGGCSEATIEDRLGGQSSGAS